MNIQFYAKNLELTGDIKNYINEKIGGLDKYEADVTECRIDLSKDTHHQKGKVYRFEVNLKLSYDKNLIRTVVEGESIMSAIDLAKDKLQRQIVKIKERKNR
jgi:ribosome hibernation promoting factor